MRILVVDIETSPHLVHSWQLYDANISNNQILKASTVLCWAAKWVGAKEVLFDSVQRSKPKKMIQAIWKLLDEADAVIHYNGTTFDIPHLNREFLRHGLHPPSPYQQIDLLRAVRKTFKFPSNKLQYVSQFLGLEGKVKHEGHELWVKCLKGDKAAWARMEKYNKRDVVITEKTYREILPWTKHPNRNVYDGTVNACPKCSSYDLTRNGTIQKKGGYYQRYNCKKCGAWSSGTSKLANNEVTVVAI